MREITKKEVDRKVFTFFILAIPTALIIMLSNLIGEKTWWAQILLAAYQFILLKQFLDSFYED